MDDTAYKLNEIGTILAAYPEYASFPTLLFAEVDSNVVGPSVYKDIGNSIMYCDPGDCIGTVLLDLWHLQSSNPPWSAIEYFLHGTRFKATYRYPDNASWDPTDHDYRERVARRYFGDKPIVYPPIPRSRPGLSFKL